MATAEEERQLRALVARVTREVTARVRGRGGGDLGPIIAAEVAAAVEALPARDRRATAQPPGAGAGAKPGKGIGEGLSRVELCASCLEEERRQSGKRAVVTTTGRNAKGIVAKIAQSIAEAGGDILDISQTLVADYFTMIIVVDTKDLEVPFAEFKARLVRAVSALGAECLVMHDDVLGALQRV